MSFDAYEFIALDLPPLLAASFAALSCALLGNFLVLRRLSLMGDSISHAILPGIVAAFLVTGSRQTNTIFIGAGIAGVIAVVLVELARDFGKVESSAAMGVVFSVMFALGVVLIEQASARNIDLDPDCLLYGQLETIFWTPPRDILKFSSLSLWSDFPFEVVRGGVTFLLALAFVGLLFKELTLAAFDSALATQIGRSATLLHYALMIAVAAAVVSSFEAVGSILVISMLICPPAAARLLSDTMKGQIGLSLVFALTSAVGGYVLAAFLPEWLGFENAWNAAGMISVLSGVLLGGAVFFSPRYGVLAKQYRLFLLKLQVRAEDFLLELYRRDEQQSEASEQVPVYDVSLSASLLNALVRRRLLWAGSIVDDSGFTTLTPEGRGEAVLLIRKHRLWESFLVEKAGFSPDHVHQSAEQLEHFTELPLIERLAEVQAFPEHDPHGRPIPDKKS